MRSWEKITSRKKWRLYELRKKEEASSVWGCLVLVGFICWGVYGVYGNLWGEREGTIKTDDCRTRIVFKEGSNDTWFKKFTCSYRKTAKGVLMSGYCEAVETTSAGACDTVYFYEKKAAPNGCHNPEMPYLGADDMCYAQPQ